MHVDSFSDAALLPQYPITTHIYDNNSVCCLEFFKYLDKAKSKGRLPPGPKPHHSSCPRKRARKRTPEKPQTGKYYVNYSKLYIIYTAF
jgi:hypothetical protein